MNATDVIRQSLEMSKQWLMALVMDLKDAPTSAGPQGHHAVWVVGHIVNGEESIISGMVLGHEPKPGPNDKLFGMGSQPQADANLYPSLDQLIAEFEAVRARTLEVLRSMTPTDLERPSHAPENMKAFFGSIGQCFTALSLHATFHAGQVADTRRALGRKPLLG